MHLSQRTTNTWLARQPKRQSASTYAKFQKERQAKLKRKEVLKGRKLSDAERVVKNSRLLDEMKRARKARMKEARANCRDFRRYLKTLRKLEDDEDCFSLYVGVLNVDLADLVRRLPGIMSLDERSRFLLVEETLKFVNRIDILTFGKKGLSRAVGFIPWDLPKGERLTLHEVREALGLR